MASASYCVMLLACFMCSVHARADSVIRFTIADIEPYLIRDRVHPDRFKGLQVELLERLAQDVGRPVAFVPIPTRRYLTAAFKPHYEGAIYSDLLVENLAAVREAYDVIEPLFQSRMFLFRRQKDGPLLPGSSIPAGIVGQVGDSCGMHLRRDVPHLKSFDIKDPEQGVLMLYKDRLDYLCLSDVVVHRLMQKLNIGKSEFDILRDMGGFNLLLLLRKDLPAVEKEAFRTAVRAGLKNGSFSELFQRYQVRYPDLRRFMEVSHH